jgi:hypothetical protein
MGVSTLTPRPTQITPITDASYNVVAGWFGVGIPPQPRQRNMTRAGYRKTGRRRGDSFIEGRRPSQPVQLKLVA